MKSNPRVCLNYFGALVLGATLTATSLLAANSGADSSATNSPGSGKSTNSAAAGSSLDDLFPDKDIARGKGVEIKRSRLDEAVAGYRATLAARGMELTPADLPVIEKKAFDHLLDVQLLLPLATDADKVKAQAEADKQLDGIRKRLPSEEAFERQLKSMNMTVDGLRSRILEEATAGQVLRDKVTVSDDEVRKYYDDNPAQFEQPEEVKADRLLLLTVDKNGVPITTEDRKAKEQMADELLKRARAGEDFAKLVKQYSDDPSSKDNGGEYTFARGHTAPELESAAFSLAPNQISDVVTSQYGFDIIKLVEKIPAKKIEFEKVQPDLRNYVENKAVEKILPSLMDKLRDAAKVEILDDQLKAQLQTAEESEKSAAALASPPNGGSTSTNSPAKP